MPDDARRNDEIARYKQLLEDLEDCRWVYPGRDWGDRISDVLTEIEVLARTTIVHEVEWRLKALLFAIYDRDAPDYGANILDMAAAQAATRTGLRRQRRAGPEP